MTLRDNKMAVLRQLERESIPITLPNLVQKLGEGFKERSVRRWLNQLVEEGSAHKIGKKRGMKYLVAKQQMTNGVSQCFSPASLEVIARIRQPLFEREPVTYAEDWFSSYQPNLDSYLSSVRRKQLLEAGRRAQDHDPAGTYAHQIFNRLLIDLSYNSSRLEGNTYSLLDTERLLLHGDGATGKLDGEKIMILNHKEAIRYLVDHAVELKISSSVIYTLHYLLSDGLVEPAEAGKVRQHGVRIAGSVYVPYEDPKHLTQQLEKIASKAALIEDPFEQSIFLLAHISYLQAFSDVNKRTARLVSNSMLIKNNLVPLAFNDVQINDYMSAMIAIYELQDVRPLVDLYVHSYLRTCSAYDTTIKAMGFDEVRVRYRQQRRDLLREIILGKMRGERMKCYIANWASQSIKSDEQAAFMEDVFEDLKEMNESRLVGLGVTPKQLKEWFTGS